jgi:hypothetical protein
LQNWLFAPAAVAAAKNAQQSVQRMAGMPSAHALGLGDGRLKLPRPIGAFFGVVSELWQFPVFNPCSPQPPLTPAVGCQ